MKCRNEPALECGLKRAGGRGQSKEGGVEMNPRLSAKNKQPVTFNVTGCFVKNLLKARKAAGGIPPAAFQVSGNLASFVFTSANKF